MTGGQSFSIKKLKMDEKLKKDLKKLAAEGEMRITRSLLRWKFKKEGKRVPTDAQLDDSSRKIADQAHQMLANSSKKAWHEIKKAYRKKPDKKGAPKA
jgi:hypothetical protein